MTEAVAMETTPLQLLAIKKPSSFSTLSEATELDTDKKKKFKKHTHTHNLKVLEIMGKYLYLF